jgi:hypothetical protein
VEKLYKRVWADLVEPVGEVLVKKGVVDGRTERVREQERDVEREREMVVGMRLCRDGRAVGDWTMGGGDDDGQWSAR